MPVWDQLWNQAKLKSSSSKPPGVLFVLLRAFGWTFFIGGLWQLSYVLLLFASPLLLNLIISFVQVARSLNQSYYAQVPDS